MGNKDLKISVKFKSAQIKLLERVLINYLEPLENQYESDEVEKLLEHLYRDKDKIIKGKIKWLEKLGYIVEKTNL